MGINYKTIKWLERNIKEKNLSMGVIGRQNINLSKSEKKKIGFDLFKDTDIYAENFLINKFKLSKVISFDKNTNEKPDYIEDFEKEINYKNKFDIFFDGGSLQHIYDVPKALKNINKMTKINGKIIHTVVFNNFQGFGFYQLSPEIFFSIYSEINGFKNTEVFLINNSNNDYWYKIEELKIGEKYNFNSNGQLSIYVSTIKKFNIENYNIDQKYYLILPKSNKISEFKQMLINKILYFKNIIQSIFPNFLLSFDKKLKKTKII